MRAEAFERGVPILLASRADGARESSRAAMVAADPRAVLPECFPVRAIVDRKSTRLNSSHLVISYAVFCLKKKTVANGGKLMQPTFVQQVTDPDGRVTQKLSPHVQSTPISPQTASELTTMMTHVTQDPQGTAAGLSVSGNVPFAGKTGTAEISGTLNGVNQPWFIAFAPATNPQVAVAATIERCQGCFGADAAGPVAAQGM